MNSGLKFGAFIAPFHGVREDPTASLQRDLRLVQYLDELGLSEAWIGEHHSGGCEIIGSPEIFIAAASERTRQIRLGTGVISVPYHHPLLLADRIIQLDHMTQGRSIFGFGPGALPSDARMMGINPLDQRRRLREGLFAVLALIEGQSPVTLTTDWFVLNEARLQVQPLTRPRPEFALASMLSPSGPALAGDIGGSLLSLTVTSEQGSSFLKNHWEVVESKAQQSGNMVDRGNWRCVAPIHIAPSRGEAIKEVEFGLNEWVRYFRDVAALPIRLGPGSDAANIINGSGIGLIGTPEEAVEFIERIQESSGGFGTFLVMAHEWADESATKRSYELLARCVAPRFQPLQNAAENSRDFLIERRPELLASVGQALSSAIRDHYGRPLQKED